MVLYQIPSFKGYIPNTKLPSSKDFIPNLKIPSSKGFYTKSQALKVLYQFLCSQAHMLSSSHALKVLNQIPSFKDFIPNPKLPSLKGFIPNSKLQEFLPNPKLPILQASRILYQIPSSLSPSSNGFILNPKLKSQALTIFYQIPTSRVFKPNTKLICS